MVKHVIINAKQGPEFNDPVCPSIPRTFTLKFRHKFKQAIGYQILHSRLRVNAVDVKTPLGEVLSKVVSSRTLTQFPEICQVSLDH